jgi:hypothetical protein
MWTPFGDLPDHVREHGRMSEQYEFLQARFNRRAFLKGAAVAGLASAGPALWLRPARATGTPAVTRYVGFGADPRTQAVVSFATASPFRQAVVEYGVDGSYGATVPADVRTVHGVRTVYGHGSLPALTPGTSYTYRVRLDGTVTTAGTLTTAPAAPAPFRFTAFGDQGISSAAKALLGRMAALRPAFHLLAGDICYADTSGSGGPKDKFDPTVWDTWLSMIEPVAASSPWMCATGNHDMEPGYGPQGYSGYLSRFLLPADEAPGTASAYAFRYGNVGFLSLDSNDMSREIPHNLGYSQGKQTTWLDQQLTAMRAPGSGIDFVVVFFHHCAFSTNARHGSDAGVREAWAPLFDRHQVDLVINGHAHLYERTSLIRHGAVAAAAPRYAHVDSSLGTTYITAGGGGGATNGAFVAGGGLIIRSGSLREKEAAPWAQGTRTTRHALLAVDVTPATGANLPAMVVRAMDRDGQVLDQVTLRRGGGGGATGGSATGGSAAGRASVDPLWVAGAGAALAAGAAGAGLRYASHRKAAQEPPAPPPGAP